MVTFTSQVAKPLAGIILFQKMCWHTLEWRFLKLCSTVDQFDNNVVDHIDFQTGEVKKSVSSSSLNMRSCSCLEMAVVHTQLF